MMKKGGVLLHILSYCTESRGMACAVIQATSRSEAIQSCRTTAMRVDSKVRYAPVTLINFVTQTVIGSMWSSLLSVAEQVYDGERPDHQAMIQE